MGDPEEKHYNFEEGATVILVYMVVSILVFIGLVTISPLWGLVTMACALSLQVIYRIIRAKIKFNKICRTSHRLDWDEK